MQSISLQPPRQDRPSRKAVGWYGVGMWRPMANGTLQHPAFTRRSVISAGAVGLMNLGLEHLTGLRSLAGASAPTPKAKSVIYIFLSGGLAQHESFDMKPDAPREIRGDFNPISTKTPGIQICEHLPRLARLSNKWALLRSLTHPHSEHSQGHHVMLTGRSEIPLGFDPSKSGSSDWPSIAALANAALPRTNNLPPALVMPDKLIHRTGRVIPGQFGGMMGSQADPWFVEMSPYRPEHYGAFPEYLFHHEKGFQKDKALAFRPPQLSLPEDVSLDRMRSRLGLRDELEKQASDLAKLNGDPSFDTYREAAVGLLSNEKVHAAFSLAKVDDRRLDAYGRNSFGWSLLVARQLVEAGTRLIQVNLGNNETWDTHQSAWPNLKNFLLPPMDRAVAALIEDLDASGLLDETLIVMGSEFGRTPKISTLPGGKALPGRDHWGHVQSVFFAGGGVKGGNVIGSSDKNGGYPETEAQTPENLAATIYQALGIPKEQTWIDLAHRPHLYYEGEPIKGLI